MRQITVKKTHDRCIAVTKAIMEIIQDRISLNMEACCISDPGTMTKLHHVKIRSKNCLLTSKKLILDFDLKPMAFRNTDTVLQIAFTAGQHVFVVSETKKENFQFSNSENSVQNEERYDGIHSTSARNDTSKSTSYKNNCEWQCMDEKCSKCLANQQCSDVNFQSFSVFDKVCYESNHIKSCEETVYDIAFEVSNVYDSVKSVIANDGTVITKPTIIDTCYGPVVIAVAKSCVGNVFHTLIDSTNFTGHFLPGYRHIDEFDCQLRNGESNSINDFYTWADHVTYAVDHGTSKGILLWYERVFQMKRFFLNRDDTPEDGFIIQGRDVGLRLSALNFWKCAEVGLKSESNLTIVLAESLAGQGPNQVDTFLSEHGCPGVQHIGLGTSDIYAVMEKLKTSNGVRFMVPPPTYYTKVGKSDEIECVGEDLRLLEKFGILLDSEADDDSREKRFLMQVFTAPIFSRDTFFLEIIQRRGARGFGAGNITALWRSVDIYLQQQDKR